MTCHACVITLLSLILYCLVIPVQSATSCEDCPALASCVVTNGNASCSYLDCPASPSQLFHPYTLQPGNGQRTYVEAQGICRGFGATLVHIDDADCANQLVNMSMVITSGAWLDGQTAPGERVVICQLPHSQRYPFIDEEVFIPLGYDYRGEERLVNTSRALSLCQAEDAVLPPAYLFSAGFNSINKLIARWAAQNPGVHFSHNRCSGNSSVNICNVVCVRRRRCLFRNVPVCETESCVDGYQSLLCARSTCQDNSEVFVPKAASVDSEGWRTYDQAAAMCQSVGAVLPSIAQQQCVSNLFRGLHLRSPAVPREMHAWYASQRTTLPSAKLYTKLAVVCRRTPIKTCRNGRVLFVPDMQGYDIFGQRGLVNPDTAMEMCQRSNGTRAPSVQWAIECGVSFFAQLSLGKPSSLIQASSPFHTSNGLCNHGTSGSCRVLCLAPDYCSRPGACQPGFVCINQQAGASCICPAGNSSSGVCNGADRCALGTHECRGDVSCYNTLFDTGCSETRCNGLANLFIPRGVTSDPSGFLDYHAAGAVCFKFGAMLPSRESRHCANQFLVFLNSRSVQQIDTTMGVYLESGSLDPSALPPNSTHNASVSGIGIETIPVTTRLPLVCQRPFTEQVCARQTYYLPANRQYSIYGEEGNVTADVALGVCSGVRGKPVITTAEAQSCASMYVKNLTTLQQLPAESLSADSPVHLQSGLCQKGAAVCKAVCSRPNPCAEPNPCPGNQLCSVVRDSFECRCAHGYQQTNASVCVDINECLDPTNCPSTSICRNTPGSYQCICKLDGRLDGLLCPSQTDLTIPICDAFFIPFAATFDEARTECRSRFNAPVAMNMSRCREQHGVRLLSSNPSLSPIRIWQGRCQSPTSCSVFELTADTTRLLLSDTDDIRAFFFCQAVNECESSSICPSGTTCMDTPESYRCDCSAGYTGNATSCMDIDECFTGQSPCQDPKRRMCVNLQGSYRCDAERDVVTLIGAVLGGVIGAIVILVTILILLRIRYDRKHFQSGPPLPPPTGAFVEDVEFPTSLIAEYSSGGEGVEIRDGRCPGRNQVLEQDMNALYVSRHITGSRSTVGETSDEAYSLP